MVTAITGSAGQPAARPTVDEERLSPRPASPSRAEAGAYHAPAGDEAGGVLDPPGFDVDLPDLPLDLVDAPRDVENAAAAIDAAVAAGEDGAAGTGPPAEGHAAAAPPPQEGAAGPSEPMQETIIPPNWLSRYEELRRFKQEHGHLDVPSHGRLGAWCCTQKQQYRLLVQGRPSHISRPRIALLAALGFEWAGARRDAFWRARHAELAAFRARHGTTRVPEKYPAAPQLHTWVSLQRRLLKVRQEGRPTTLTDERIRMLEELGLESGRRATTTWMDRFMELKRYKDEHGDCDVPQKWKPNVSLGRWVDNQKTQHKKLYDGKPTHLTIERIQLLVSIGFNWRPS